MIKQNCSSDLESHDQNNDIESRDFTRILRAAEPLLEVFLPQPENHIARVLVSTAIGKAFTADLSFNKYRKRVILVIRLRTKNGLSSSQLQSILRLQSRIEGLSSLTFDEETGIVKIRSQSVLPAPILAKVVVPHVIQDAVAILEDDYLKDIVDQSVSY
jgi:hypothetical protein